jgi:hypothetical protein
LLSKDLSDAARVQATRSIFAGAISDLIDIRVFAYLLFLSVRKFHPPLHPAELDDRSLGKIHTSGLPAVVAEGITIVTPEAKRNFR